jgi:tetratricopeptide (TPR) repeat protein
MGRLEAVQEKYNESADLLWQGLRYSEDELTTGFLESALGDSYYALRQYKNAFVHYNWVKNYRERIGDTFRLCSVLCDLADLSRKLGDIKQSMKLYKDALALAKSNNRSEIIARCHGGLGKLYLSLEETPTAKEHLEKASDSFEILGRERERLRMQELLDAADKVQVNESKRKEPEILNDNIGIDLLLINPPRKLAPSKDNTFQDHRLPLGLVNISSFLRQRGLKTRIIDAEALSLGISDLIKEANRLSPG